MQQEMTFFCGSGPYNFAINVTSNESYGSAYLQLAHMLMIPHQMMK